VRRRRGDAPRWSAAAAGTRPWLRERACAAISTRGHATVAYTPPRASSPLPCAAAVGMRPGRALPPRGTRPWLRERACAAISTRGCSPAKRRRRGAAPRPSTAAAGTTRRLPGPCRRRPCSPRRWVTSD
jgi:hypothetical protein